MWLDVLLSLWPIMVGKRTKMARRINLDVLQLDHTIQQNQYWSIVQNWSHVVYIQVWVQSKSKWCDKCVTPFRWSQLKEKRLLLVWIMLNAVIDIQRWRKNIQRCSRWKWCEYIAIETWIIYRRNEDLKQLRSVTWNERPTRIHERDTETKIKRVVLLNYHVSTWYYFCNYCNRELDKSQQLWKDYTNTGLFPNPSIVQSRIEFRSIKAGHRSAPW